MTDLSISDELDFASVAAVPVLEVGPLAGQGRWTGEEQGGRWLVRDGERCPDGLPTSDFCLTLDDAADAAQENTLSSGKGSFLPNGRTKISFGFYPDWRGEPNVSFSLRGLSLEERAVLFSLNFYTAEQDSFYILLNGVGLTEGDEVLRPLERWYEVELELDTAEERARFRMDALAWSAWVPWYKSDAPLNALQLRGFLEKGNGFYLSDVEMVASN